MNYGNLKYKRRVIQVHTSSAIVLPVIFVRALGLTKGDIVVIKAGPNNTLIITCEEAEK
jgi:antitoxin component of MazEF toxin-antitoxin module